MVVPGVDEWFGSVQTDQAPAAGLRVVAELVSMLDRAQPTLLDRQRSAIDAAGHHWPEYDLRIRLLHQEDADAEVTIAVSDQGAVVSWVSTHEHVDPEDGTDERPWTTVVVDLVAAVLRGEYVVETRYKRDRPVQARILDMIDPEAPRLVSTTGTLLSSWLPWPRVTRTEQRRLSYGTREEG